MGCFLTRASHGTGHKHPAKCLCFFFSKCGLEANFKAALYASVKCSQKLWTRKIPANTQLCTVAVSWLNTNYRENAAEDTVGLQQVLLGKLPLLVSHFRVQVKEQACRLVMLLLPNHIPDIMKRCWVWNFITTLIGQLFCFPEKELNWISSGRHTELCCCHWPKSQNNTYRLWENATVSQLWRKKKRAAKVQNLTQSSINSISSIHLLMIKCCHCSLVAKFNDDRQLGKQVDRQKDRYPQLLQPSIISHVLPSLI